MSESDVDARVVAGVLDFAETGNMDKIPAGKIPGSLTHRQAAAVTVSGSTLDIPTEDSVQGGDTVLFVIPSPWSVTGNLTVRVSQGGTVQADTTFALNDRVGTRLTGGDVVADEEMKIVLATDWRSLVHPVGSGDGASLSNSTPSEHGIGQSGAAGTGTQASRSDHVHAIPVGVPVATGDANAEGTATTASRSDHVHQNGVFSWGFVIDTLIVPELNQDAITTARIVLEDSALTHYLAFLDWTAANLGTISHLPVGAHIGLRQGTTIRILRVEAEWDSTNNRYQVINVNAGGILEEASGTATELLLTAGGGGGTAGAADLKGQRIASITFGAVPTSGSSLETSASGSGSRLDSGDIGGTGSDVGWVRDTGAPTAFTVERIGASSDEPVINVPQTRAAANVFGYLVELEILPFLGTLSNAISDSATSIVFTAESTEDIAVGDELRIESETVTVDAVPADGATGVAARTYGITRGSNPAAHTNTRAVQRNEYELESDGIILQGGPSPQQGGSTSRSTVSLGTGGLVDATGIRELGVRLTSTRSTVGLSGLEQTRLIDLISQGDNAVLLPSTRITVYLAVIAAGAAAEGGQESPGTPEWRSRTNPRPC